MMTTTSNVSKAFLETAASGQAVQAALSESVRAAELDEIPRIVHFCFLDWRNMKDPYLSWVMKWKDILGSEWVFVNWTPETTEPIHPLEIWWLENDRRAFYADWQRIHKVTEYGGFYLDCDIDLHKTLEPLRDLDYCFDTEAVTSFPEFGIFGAKKGNRFMKTLRDAYDSASPEDYSADATRFLIGRFCKRALLLSGVTMSFSAETVEELRENMKSTSKRIMWCMNSTQLSNPRDRIDRSIVPYNADAYSTHCFTNSWNY